jgi:NAD-dependent dihydropyrimidine dehydrogenase PreA subunit
MTNEFELWHGMKRSDIKWYPIIDPNKCTGCGLCVVTCGEKRNVFGYDISQHKAVVLFPNNCMVGCNNCQVSCLWKAISYPEDAEYVRGVAENLSQDELEEELRRKLESNHSLVLQENFK